MNLVKSSWVYITENFGESLFHPQSQLLKYQKVGIQLAKKYAKGKLVDIGCGRMPYRKEIEPLVDKYVGVDHPNVSKLYNSKIQPDVLADAKKLPFSANTFDIALLFQVLEHVESPEAVLKEAARVLKPNGVLVITIPFLCPLHDMPHDWARYTSTALKDFLTKAGIQIIKIEVKGTFFQFWFQMLNTFISKRIYDILKGGLSIYLLILPIIILFAIPIIIINNILILLFEILDKFLPKLPDYFPLQYIAIGRKK